MKNDISSFIHEHNRAQDYGVDSLYYRYEKMVQKAILYDMAHSSKTRAELEKMYDVSRQRFWEILEDLTHAHKNIDDETKKQKIKELGDLFDDEFFNH